MDFTISISNAATKAMAAKTSQRATMSAASMANAITTTKTTIHAG